MKVQFHPQAWQNDYAVDVDPEGETKYDIGDVPETMKNDTYESDDYKTHENAPEWVHEWQGLFWIEILEPDPPETITVRLTIDVRYIPNGEPEEALHDLLDQVATEAANNGLFTGETAAEVDEWTSSITVVQELATPTTTKNHTNGDAP